MVAMEVIMNAGDGRDKIDEALAAMAEGKLDEVDKLLEEAEALIVKAHNAQTSIKTRIPVNTLIEPEAFINLYV